VIEEFKHISVLLNESIEMLDIKPDGIYADLTAGGGGHSSEILKHLTTGKLFSFDRDPDAISAATKRLNDTLEEMQQKPEFELIQANYSQIGEVLDGKNVPKLDGILMDLGVSSHQLDTPDRGFSYKYNAPLDMRMSKSGISAFDVVNTYSEKDLARIIFEYGEDKCSRKIASNIVKKREISPINTTFELAEIISESVPAALKRTKNPSKKTFQAIRIEVNQEFQHLEKCLEDSFKRLKPGGTFVIITFHSLEDRIVKRFFAKQCEGCTCPKTLPVCVCGNTPKATQISRKPLIPSEQELSANNRSHSAKLRGVKLIHNS
jgi:16S rRNA (cytosine1402-N4)-methyltransferase